jgi:hypothetical protein
MIAEILNIIFPAPRQVSTERIYKPYLTNMLRTKFPDADIRLSDTSFKLVDVRQFKLFLGRNTTNHRPYVKEIHDCDDFSFVLKGDVTRWDSDLAFGIVWAINPEGTYHALNIMVGTDKEVYFVEPQTDEVFGVSDEWVVRFILM